MRIENNWICFADKALKDVGIVRNDYKIKKKEEDKDAQEIEEGEYVYPEAFSGYMSSLGATIVNTGIYPALIIYENKSSNTDGKRYLIPKAILNILTKVINETESGSTDILPAEGSSLSEKYHLSNNKDLLKMYIEKAATALKITLRMYKSVKVEEKQDGKDNKDKGNKNINTKKITKAEYDEDHRVNSKANVGWLFYRDYYRNYTSDDFKYEYLDNKGKKKIIEGKFQELLFIKKKNPFILNSSLTGTEDNEYNMLTDNKRISNILKNKGFDAMSFKTTNPGLLIGMGLEHGTNVENDLKCGFQFDYTTGLPYIPGSSVKGVLRSVFPFKGDEKEDLKYLYIESLLKNEKNKILDEGYYDVEFSEKDIKNLAKDIFVHEDKSSYDIFMDAIITGCDTKDGKFLSDDFITPQHENPFGDPNPIQFIKVLPKIEFTFFFKLTECECKGVKINLKNLFKCILEDIGVGAKTNVGYGQLKFVR